MKITSIAVTRREIQKEQQKDRFISRKHLLFKRDHKVNTKVTSNTKKLDSNNRFEDIEDNRQFDDLETDSNERFNINKGKFDNIIVPKEAHNVGIHTIRAKTISSIKVI